MINWTLFMKKRRVQLFSLESKSSTKGLRLILLFCLWSFSKNCCWSIRIVTGLSCLCSMEFLKGQSRRKLRFVYLLYVVNHQKLMKQRKNSVVIVFWTLWSKAPFIIFFSAIFFPILIRVIELERTLYLMTDGPTWGGLLQNTYAPKWASLKKGRVLSPLARQQQNRVVKERLSSFHSLTTFFSPVGQSYKSSRLARCMSIWPGTPKLKSFVESWAPQ